MTDQPRRARPKAPAGLAARGRAFWRDVTGSYQLERDEVELLAEACRTLDLAEALQARIAADGPMTLGSMNQPRVHPAVGELRQARALLARLLGQLGLPPAVADPAEDKAAKATTSELATRAARARWSKQPGGGRRGA